MKLRIFASLLTALALVASAAAVAQSTPDYTPRVSVSPLVALPGVARTITVSGVWPTLCGIGGIRLSESPVGQTGPLTIQFLPVLVSSACPAIVENKPYSYSTAYTPTVPGRREVVMSTSYGTPVLGFGEIITSESATQARGGTDITGAWYDPITNGSGFAFYHSHEGSGVLAGTFYGFDNAGRPFWYLVQNVRWSSATGFVASLVEITSQPGSCVLLTACNQLMQVAQTKGDVIGQVLADGRILARIWVRLPTELVEVTTFNLQRINF